MKRHKGFLVLSLLLFIQKAYSQQKDIESVEQFWPAYINQTRISDRWAVWSDLQYRRTSNFFDRELLWLARTALTYYINEKVKVSAGFSYIYNSPAAGHEHVSQPELRPYQQLLLTQKLGKIIFNQRVRIEERFVRKIEDDFKLSTGYHFNYRFRHQAQCLIPLNKESLQPGTIYASLADEILINFGKQVLYNYFDHNRIIAEGGYQINKSSTIQLGYMNSFQQRRSGNSFYRIHSIRLAYIHNLDLRKVK